MADFERGTYFASYRIVRLVGESQVAKVYEVATPDGRRRALKVLDAEVDPTSKLYARLVKEGEAIATIEHVNVVSFFQWAEEGRRVGLVLELVAGEDLLQRMRDAGGKLSVERTVRIVRQACEGVAAAHALGIVHRDLRPENILVTDDDGAKVADFGSAKLPGFGLKTTQAGELSTALCMAPEVIEGRAEPRSDVYSMGLLIYQALTGVPPMAPTPTLMYEVCRRQRSYTPPPLDTLGLGIPGDLSDLVQRALAKDPTLRPTMREFADGLAGVLYRLNAPRRAAARNVGLQRADPRLARTEPAMVAWPGTEEGADEGRAALLPACTEPPSTLRSGEEPGPWVPRALLGATIKIEVVAAPAERGSTGMPVVRATAPAAVRGRAGVGVAGVVTAAGVVAAGWVTVGRGAGVPVSGVGSAVPVGSATGAPTAPAAAGSAAGPVPAATASASAAPAKPAAAARPRARPGKTRLPFP